MQAMTIDIPSLHPDVLPKDQREAAAARLVQTIMRHSAAINDKRLTSLARKIWAEHAATIWGTLGLYWYYLGMSNANNAVLCEQILRSRFLEMDAQQSRFFGQCIPWLKEIQGRITPPSPARDELDPLPFLSVTSHDAPGTAAPSFYARQSAPAALQVCTPADFKRVLDAEHEEDNRKQMQVMLPITQRKALARIPATAIAEIEKLRDEQPNMTEALDIILGELRARFLADAPAKLPSILLCGGPGTGKTRLVSEIARIMRLPCTPVPLAGSSDAFKITGLSRYWRSAGCGLIARTFCDNGHANPVFIFDEIDKAGQSPQGNPHDAILLLLEENTAKAFRDEFILAPIDASHASFLATANRTDDLPAPLLSRFIVVEIPELRLTDRIRVTSSIYKQLVESEPYGPFFAEAPSGVVVEAMAKDEKLSPRLIRQHLKRAMQQACRHLTRAPRAGSLVLEMGHLPDSAIRGKARIGFMF